MRGERGWCTMLITLAPTVPPRIQTWDIESTLPAAPALQHAAEQVALCVAKPTRRALRALCANNIELTPLWDQVRLANILCGSGALGAAVGGDGATWASFPFQGSKGNATLQIKVDMRGKVTDLRFQPTNNTAQ